MEEPAENAAETTGETEHRIPDKAPHEARDSGPGDSRAAASGPADSGATDSRAADSGADGPDPESAGAANPEGPGAPAENGGSGSDPGTGSRPGKAWWHRHPRWTAGVAVTAAVAGAFAGGWFAAPPDHPYTPQVPASQPVSISAAQARDGSGASTWPTLGNRANDRGPGHAAMEILLSGGFGPHSWVDFADVGPDSDSPIIYEDHRPSGEIMFSGTAPGLPQVTLVSTGGQLLRYATGPGAGSEKLVHRAPVPWEMSPGSGPPIALNWDNTPDEAHPLAVPPWLTNVQVEGIDGKNSGWRPLKVTDGLSAPIPELGYRSSDFDQIVDAKGDCGIGVLIQAVDTAGSKPTKVTFVYGPGWPYAVSVEDESDAGTAGSQAAPFDQASFRRLAGALLCGAPGTDRVGPPVSRVSWSQEWRGTPSPGGGEVAVVQQEVTYPSGGNYGGHERSGLLEVGIDRPSVYTDLGSNYNDGGGGYPAAISVGCVNGTGGLTVVGPSTATTISLVDPLTGQHWSAHSHVLKVAKGQLPRKGTALTATAVTPGKTGATSTGNCTAP